MAQQIPRDPREVDDDEQQRREDFYSGQYRRPIPPPPREMAPLGMPPLPREQTAAEGTIPAIPKPPTTLRERLEQRDIELQNKLNPPRKTGWGRFGQVMGTIGQDIGTAVAPGVMAAIPGTTLNRRMELANVRRALGEEQERESEAGLRGAQTQEAQAKIRAMGHWKAVPGTIEQDPDTGQQRQLWEIPETGQQAYASPEGAGPGTLPSIGAPTGAAPQIPGTIQGVQHPPLPPPGAPPPPTATGAPPLGATPPVAPPAQQRWIKGNVPEAERRMTPAEIAQGNKEFEAQWQVLHPGQPLDPAFKLPDNANKTDYDRIAAQLKDVETATGTQAQRENTKAQQEFNRGMARDREQRQKEEEDRRKEEAAGKWVVAVDNDNKRHYLTRGDYDSHARDFHPNPGTLPPGAYDKALDHTTTINEMQGRMNALEESAQRFDWSNGGQQSIVQQALQHVEDSYADKVIGVPIMNWVAQNLKQLGLSGATDATREYIIDLLSVRESLLGMPKEITGGSRAQDRAIQALYQTLPAGETPNYRWAHSQLLAVQSIIDRLQGTRVPIIDGVQHVDKIPDLHKYIRGDQNRRIYSDDKKNWVDEEGRKVDENGNPVR